MNPQITRLFTVIVVLFGLLVVFTSRWTVFQADSLENQEIDGQRVNQRPLLEQQRIPRGIIRAEDRTRLATNKFGSPWYIRVGDKEPAPLLDWLREHHPPSSDL